MASLATAGLMLLIAWASAAPLRLRDADTSRLRLSWSARPERIEQCRTVSAEELARREEHMRQRVECEGHFATYELKVESDGSELHEQVVRGAGLRHDRPLYLLRDLTLAPGVHRIRVTFERREKTDDDAAAFTTVAPAGSDSGIFAGRAEREVTERARRARAAIPPRLALDTTLMFTVGRVTIVTFDPDSRTLHVLGGPNSPR